MAQRLQRPQPLREALRQPLRQQNLLPYVGPGWYPKVSLAAMLELGVCRWDHIVLGISARRHVNAATLRRALERMDAAWQGKEHMAKLSVNAMIGLWPALKEHRTVCFLAFDGHCYMYRAVKRVLERAARVLYRSEARQTLPPIQEWRRFDAADVQPGLFWCEDRTAG